MWSRLNRPWKRICLFLLSSSLGIVIFITIFWDTINEIPDRWHMPLLNPEPLSSLGSPTEIFELGGTSNAPRHVIDNLVEEAEAEQKRLLSRRTNGVSQAARAYRERRGRNPPPLFDEWVAFAESRDALVIEEVFDRIYHDLAPFWALPPDQIRADADAIEHWVEVRQGKAYRSAPKGLFVERYFDMINSIAKVLPDVRIPVNHMDEPRVVVPWDDVSAKLQKAEIEKAQYNVRNPPQINKVHNEH